MGGAEKKTLGIINTVYEAMQFLYENKLEKNITLLDDICFALQTLEVWASEQKQFKNIDSGNPLREELNKLKETKDMQLFQALTHKVDHWLACYIQALFSGEVAGEGNIIVINTDDIAAPTEGNNLFESRQNVMSASSGVDGPLVTVIIVGFNRLDKTKQCVESFLRNSSNVRNRLILLDNGSSDGTFEYFKSVPHYDKTVIRVTKNIGSGLRNIAALAKVKTKYLCSIPNDMILTPNFLDNLLKCAMSDPRIGIVVPCSSNVSNFQDPGLQFSSLAELEKIARRHNVSDPRKWHERLRLMTLTQLVNMECSDVTGGSDYGFFHDFRDDDLSFRIRRSGYKTVLCLDTFVHHNHAVFSGEGKDPEKFQKSLAKGRENFQEKFFGVDAWSDVNNYEFNLVNFVRSHPAQTAPKLLGVDVRCGTPLLEIKNRLRGYDIDKASLAAFSQQAKYYVDLSTICDAGVVCDRVEHIGEYYAKSTFDWIIIGTSVGAYSEPVKLLKNVLALLKPGGQLLLKLFDTTSILPDEIAKSLEKEVNNQFFTFDGLENKLRVLNAGIMNHITEKQEAEPEIIAKIEKFFNLLNKRGIDIRLVRQEDRTLTVQYQMVQIVKHP